jgi:hypothetical protein
MARIRGLRASRADACFNSWIAWRAACDSVEAAYREWATAGVRERPLAFAWYRTALAREEEHAASYAAVATAGPPLGTVGS